MAIVMEMHWPEIGLDEYQEARRRLRWEQEFPVGAISHVAWMADDGFHVVDTWESAEQFDAFVNDRLMPVMVGEMGITSQPKVTVTAAHAVFVPYARVEGS